VARGPGSPQRFAHYDRRQYPTLPVGDGYARWARSYGELDDRFDVDLLAASPHLGARLAGSTAVDLACGNGRIGKFLRSASVARVVGVDMEPAMLAGARDRGVYAALVRAPIERTPFATGAFDGATCSMALCHVGELHAFFAEARRLVRAGGWLAVVDYHPAFLMRGIPTHFHDPEMAAPIAIENYVHALRDFFQIPTRAGFVVREMEERFVDEEWATTLRGYQAHLGWPVTHSWVYEAA
jgi:SAM-dependent methyltransferase